MTDKNDITGVTDKKSVINMDEDRSEHPIEYSEHRRRILKGAAAAAPLMMTIASRPALGWGGGRCQGISGHLSGNLSDHKDKYYDCGGHGPRYWKKHDWGGTGCYKGGDSSSGGTWGGNYWSKGGNYWSKDSKSGSDGTPFHQYSRLRHQRGIFPGRFFKDKTMLEVLSSDGREDPHELGKYTICAYLNAKTDSRYGMTPEEVVKAYDQIRRTGYYQVGGHRVSAQEFVMYIKNTITDSDSISSWDRDWSRH